MKSPLEHLFRGYRIGHPQEVQVTIMVCESCGQEFPIHGRQDLADRVLPLIVGESIEKQGCLHCGGKEFNYIGREMEIIPVDRTQVSSLREQGAA